MNTLQPSGTEQKHVCTHTYIMYINTYIYIYICIHWKAWPNQIQKPQKRWLSSWDGAIVRVESQKTWTVALEGQWNHWESQRGLLLGESDPSSDQRKTMKINKLKSSLKFPKISRISVRHNTVIHTEMGDLFLSRLNWSFGSDGWFHSWHFWLDIFFS